MFGGVIFTKPMPNNLWLLDTTSIVYLFGSV